jgi:integrase
MFYLENKDDVDGIIMNPFSNIIKTKNKHERQEQALERELDWKWIEKIEKLRYQLPNGVVINEVDLCQGDWIIGRGYSNENKKIVRDEKLRLLSLILAHTGLSWVDLGKEDVFQIQRSITGPVLIGRRVKTKEKYTIPVTPKLEELIIEMGSLPWKPFVENNVLTDHAARQGTYMNFYNYLNERLAPQIGFDEDDTISPHRFRHSFAMRMLNHFKFSLHVVARMLGDLESTVRQNYADYDDDTITAAFNEEMKRYLKNKKDDDKSKEEIAV